VTYASSRTTDGPSHETAGAPAWVIFTDLDGTLLDRANYGFDAARPALDAVRARGIPLVPVTSKTRAELVPLRAVLGTGAPYVVENGGAIIVPRGAFTTSTSRTGHDAEEVVIAIGANHREVAEALDQAARETGVRVRGFSAMDDVEVAAATGLSREAAALARRREHGEAFTILDGEGTLALLAALERRGYRWTRGGRFHHAFAGNDKGSAVRWLIARYRAQWPAVRTIGLGDAPNDVPMLAEVDVAVVVRGPHAAEVHALVPHATTTAAEGPAGWNAAVLSLLGA
jgi:mannosyl-3-phosphoglycerate phosphatase